MAHSGVGLWIAQEDSSTICLYHTETFRHIQDINVASNINRMLLESGKDIVACSSKISVTSLIACKGLLWVGTNVGVALTIPLPRLEGIPIISGRANISFHAHLGPITFLLSLQSQPARQTISNQLAVSNNNFLSPENQSLNLESRSSTVPPPPSPTRLEKQQSDGILINLRKLPQFQQQQQPKIKQPLGSPVTLRKKSKEPRDFGRRLSKTLPRNSGLTLSGSQEYDVYGLCGALMNVQGYDEDAMVESSDCSGGSLGLSRYDSMRRSDPEIALPAQVNTLDRRLRLKASRPRSLDLSTWSVDSRASSACTTVSSGSEESGSAHYSNSPSTAKRQLSGASFNQKSISTNNRRKEIERNRTLMVVMGGRGYVNLQKRELASSADVNSNDAHVIVWEMKL